MNLIKIQNMKKIIISLFLFVATIHTFAQTPMSFSYQTVIIDQEGLAISSEELILEVSILEDSDNGTVVFSETHTTTTSPQGIIHLQIGAMNSGIGNIADLDWYNQSYFLKISLNSIVLSVDKINTKPYSVFANEAQTVSQLDYTQLTGTPDFTNWDQDATDDFDADYNSLSNLPALYDFDGEYTSLLGELPTTITVDQSNTLDLFSLSSPFSLTGAQPEIAINLTKISFPGYGTTATSAIEGQAVWIESEGDMFHNGPVGINTTNIPKMQNAGLMVNGAVLFENTTIFETTAGLMFYDQTMGDGSICFYDELGVKQIVETGVIDPGANYHFGNSIIEYNDVATPKNLIVGDNAQVGYPLNGNSMAFVENIIRLKFHDTSNSASFPSNDWSIDINDTEFGGDNYFAITDINANNTAFKVMAAAPSYSIFVGETQVALGHESPTEKLEVDGVVTATAFIGSASQLTDIDASGSGLVDNLGSTTLNADNNMDNVGDIIFNTKGIDKMTIKNDGKVGIGTDAPTAELEVLGHAKFNNIEALFSTSGTLVMDAVDEAITTNFQTVDITGKSVIYLTASISGLYVQLSSIDYLQGQEVIFINKGTNAVIIYNNSGSAVLNQYDSVTIVYAGGFYQTASTVN